MKSNKYFRKILLKNMYFDLSVIKANINDDKQVRASLEELKIAIDLWFK